MKKYRSLAFLQQSPHFLVNRTYSVGLLKLKTEDWEQHAEILSKAVGTGTSFYEVPISYPGRTYDEGKKIRPSRRFSNLDDYQDATVLLIDAIAIAGIRPVCHKTLDLLGSRHVR